MVKSKPKCIKSLIYDRLLLKLRSSGILLAFKLTVTLKFCHCNEYKNNIHFVKMCQIDRSYICGLHVVCSRLKFKLNTVKLIAVFFFGLHWMCLYYVNTVKLPYATGCASTLASCATVYDFIIGSENVNKQFSF